MGPVSLISNFHFPFSPEATNKHLGTFNFYSFSHSITLYKCCWRTINWNHYGYHQILHHIACLDFCTLCSCNWIALWNEKKKKSLRLSESRNPKFSTSNRLLRPDEAQLVSIVLSLCKYIKFVLQTIWNMALLIVNNRICIFTRKDSLNLK